MVLCCTWYSCGVNYKFINLCLCLCAFNGGLKFWRDIYCYWRCVVTTVWIFVPELDRKRMKIWKISNLRGHRNYSFSGKLNSYLLCPICTVPGENRALRLSTWMRVPCHWITFCSKNMRQSKHLLEI